MNFNDMSYVQFLKTLANQLNDNTDTSDPNNTLIQYFDAPYDQLTFSSQVLAWLTSSGQHITSTDTDKLTFGASVTPVITDPTTIVWDDGTGLSNWLWSANGVWG